jgi:hypothetical protein
MASTSFDSLVARVRGEYVEMPGLRLTVSQACRLWHVDRSTCEMLFEQLVREGFLYKTEKSAYIATGQTRGELA